MRNYAKQSASQVRRVFWANDLLAFSPEIAGQFESRVRARAAELYGDRLPETVSDRIEEELGYAAESDAGAMMLAVSDAFREAGLDAEDVSIRGAAGNSYLAYLLGVNGGIEPLPPHYRCAHCRRSEFDVPEAIRVGVELPQKDCPACGAPMIGEGFDLEPRFFYGASPNQTTSFDYNIPVDKKAAVIKALQKSESLMDIDQTDISNREIAIWSTLALMTRPMTNQLFKLGTLTGIRPRQIPIGNSADISAVRETLRRGGSFIGVTCLMGRFEEYILTQFSLDGLYDIARFFALCHGTGVWLGNGERLLKNETITQDELPTCREDVFAFLRKAGFDRKTAFGYAEQIRKGKGFSTEQENELRVRGVPWWFIGYCNRISYLFPMAHCISEALMAWRLLYYKLCVDQGKFYQAFFETAEGLTKKSAEPLPSERNMWFLHWKAACGDSRRMTGRRKTNTPFGWRRR